MWQLSNSPDEASYRLLLCLVKSYTKVFPTSQSLRQGLAKVTGICRYARKSTFDQNLFDKYLFCYPRKPLLYSLEQWIHCKIFAWINQQTNDGREHPPNSVTVLPEKRESENPSLIQTFFVLSHNFSCLIMYTASDLLKYPLFNLTYIYHSSILSLHRFCIICTIRILYKKRQYLTGLLKRKEQRSRIRFLSSNQKNLFRFVVTALVTLH